LKGDERLCQSLACSSCNLQPNLATPEKKKKWSEARAQRAQCTLQVEEQIPEVQGIMDSKKPHTHVEQEHLVGTYRWSDDDAGRSDNDEGFVARGYLRDKEM
jgi:hypothetical protein